MATKPEDPIQCLWCGGYCIDGIEGCCRECWEKNQFPEETADMFEKRKLREKEILEESTKPWVNWKRKHSMKTIKDLIKAIRDYSEIPDNRPTANRMFKAWADWLEKYEDQDTVKRLEDTYGKNTSEGL